MVLTDVRDENGTMLRAVTLTEDGGLAIRGRDLGRRVEAAFGCTEHELERRLSARETKTLSGLLNGPTGIPLLMAIVDRFPAGIGLEEFTREHGIEVHLWNRIGD